MYVSSFTTHIDANAVNKAHNRRESDAKKSSINLDKKTKQTQSQALLTKNSSLPVNYISNYKALNNKQLLEEKSEPKASAKMKFSQLKSLDSAHSAYEENSSSFSFFTKPKVTLDQTPRLDRRLPPQAAKAQEDTLKSLMVNTYIANENYYKITA